MPTPDPEITAVNAAFALGLVEGHSLVESTHRLYDLARAAAADAPTVDFETFNQRFLSLSPDSDKSEYRIILVELTELYAWEAVIDSSPPALRANYQLFRRPV